MSSTTRDTKLVNPHPTRPHAWGNWSLRAIAILYLLLFIAVPLAAVVEQGVGAGLARIWTDLTAPIALHALALTLWTAALMVAVNSVMGTLIAFALVRYSFPLKWLFNAVIDLPFAIPTLVSGIMLVVLFGPQETMGALLKSHGFQVIFAPPGIVMALLFVSLPFVVRAVQPVLIEMDEDQEEAAYTLGASSFTTFRRVVLPTIAPAVASGALLSFARGVGEFGSIVVVAGNIPNLTLTAPVFIYGDIESGNMTRASAMSVVLLAISFGLVLTVDFIQRRKEVKLENGRH